MSNRGNYGAEGTGDRGQRRHYVEVIVDTSPEGVVTPLTIVWDTGVRYHIDRVLDRRLAQSLRTGGTGVRYTILVGPRTTHLFYDDVRGAWFVEERGT